METTSFESGKIESVKSYVSFTGRFRYGKLFIFESWVCSSCRICLRRRDVDSRFGGHGRYIMVTFSK